MLLLDIDMTMANSNERRGPRSSIGDEVGGDSKAKLPVTQQLTNSATNAMDALSLYLAVRDTMELR